MLFLVRFCLDYLFFRGSQKIFQDKKILLKNQVDLNFFKFYLIRGPP